MTLIQKRRAPPRPDACTIIWRSPITTSLTIICCWVSWTLLDVQLQHGLKLAETYEMLGVLLYLYSTQGEIHLYQAEWTAATEMFQRGLSLAEELNHLERQAGYRAGLALAARGQNDLDRAIALLEEGLALIAGQGYWHLRARLQIWLAEILLAR